MRITIQLIVFIIAVCYQTDVSAKLDVLNGTSWRTNKDNNIVKITMDAQGQMVGILTRSDNPEAKLNITIIKNMTFTENNWHAELYLPKRKVWYPIIMSHQQNQLTIKIKVGLFSKTLNWQAVAEQS